MTKSASIIHNERMKNHLGTIVLVLLLIASIVLGYVLYQRLTATPTATQQEEISPETEPLGSPSESSPSARIYSESYLATLTPDERSVLALKRDSESMKANQELINKVAKTAEVLDISQCEPVPLVFKIDESAQFQIKNNDSVEHRIVIGSSFKKVIPAGSTETATADFGHSFGVYGATCDEKDSGFVVVAQIQ